ncbi:MAG TPA: HepT-like ribonuclease domain-containing protein [Stellaceae bacterium]|nr:HepT-like ribonuclease domain-containing protein [Stellaceae bacterium]
MIDAARAARRFIAGRGPADLDADEMLVFALVRAVEIIGMSNRLVHAYFDVDKAIVWKAVSEEVPLLLPLLLQALPPA